MSDYDYDVVDTFTSEAMIEDVTLGEANDEGWQRLRFKTKTGLNEPSTKTINSSIRVNFDRFTRPSGGNDDLTDNKRMALNIAKQQFAALQTATGILRVAKDEKGKAIVNNGKVTLVGTPLTADTISRLAGRYLKVKVGPSSLNPDQYDYKGFYPPGNGHQNPTDDNTPF